MAEAVAETAEEPKETVENAVSDMAELAEQLKKENESLKKQNDELKEFIQDLSQALGFDPEAVAEKADETKDAVEGISQNNSNLASSSIEGTWKLTSMKSDKPENAEFVSQMELLLANGLMENTYIYADGKVTMTAKTNVPGAENQDMTMNGTYTIEGNQLTVIEDGHTTGDPVEFRITGDTLELITPEMTMTFVRK